MWIIYAFGSAFFAGITAILAKIGVRDVNSNLATALRTIVVAVFSWLIVFAIGSYRDIGSLSDKSVLFLILSGLSTGASWLCYFRALQTGNVNKVAPIDKSSTVLTMILAFIFLGEPLSLNMVLGMAGIAAGTLLMLNLKKGDAPAMQPKNRSWLFYALLAASFASLTSILGKIGIEDIESNLGTAIRTLVVLALAWAIVFAQKKQREIPQIQKRNWVFLLLSGIATGLSWLCFYRALQDGNASIVVPIDKLSIVVTVLFSVIVLKEKLTKPALIGLLLIVAGTLLLLFYF